MWGSVGGEPGPAKVVGGPHAKDRSCLCWKSVTKLMTTVMVKWMTMPLVLRVAKTATLDPVIQVLLERKTSAFVARVVSLVPVVSGPASVWERRDPQEKTSATTNKTTIATVKPTRTVVHAKLETLGIVTQVLPTLET